MQLEIMQYKNTAWYTVIEDSTEFPLPERNEQKTLPIEVNGVHTSEAQKLD